MSSSATGKLFNDGDAINANVTPSIGASASAGEMKLYYYLKISHLWLRFHTFG
jgi:hypothetical protein